MAVRSLGSLTIGRICIGLSTSVALLVPYLSGLQGEVASVGATLKVAMGLQIPDALALAKRLQALILSLPSILAELTKVSASGGLTAQLSARLAALNAQVTAVQVPLGTLQAALSSGGVEAFVYEGPSSSFGGEIGSHVGGSETAHVLVLVAREPTAWKALSSIFYTG